MNELSYEAQGLMKGYQEFVNEIKKKRPGIVWEFMCMDIWIHQATKHHVLQDAVQTLLNDVVLKSSNGSPTKAIVTQTAIEALEEALKG